jgi:hypothetical protein
MVCTPGKETTARNAMNSKCTFTMKEKKDPYSQSIVEIEGRQGGGKRRSRKASRKNRKASRKNRKASRKNRK